MIEGTVVELVLQRLDQDVGSARIPMRQDSNSATPRFVADASLPAGTRWDATVVALTGGAGDSTSHDHLAATAPAGGS